MCHLGQIVQAPGDEDPVLDPLRLADRVDQRNKTFAPALRQIGERRPPLHHRLGPNVFRADRFGLSGGPLGPLHGQGWLTIEHVDLGDRGHRTSSLLAGWKPADSGLQLSGQRPRLFGVVALVGNTGRQPDRREAGLAHSAGGDVEEATDV